MRMRQEPALHDIPVVIVSGHDLMEGAAFLGTPIRARSGQHMEIVPGGKCLKGMIDAMNPNYLTEQADPELSQPIPWD